MRLLMAHPELIVMLTHNDKTVSNAAAIFQACKASKAKYWGFKEKPLPLDEMKALFSEMKACGKTTVLEVVEYTEDQGLEGAQIALACGVDILMGTVYSEKIHNFCQEHDLKYMPFVGDITERPSILNGSIDGMVAEAQTYLDKGVFGIDLLGYRYTGNPLALNQALVSQLAAPICLAGSVDSYERLQEVKDTNPRFFTIGSAFFEQRFGETFEEQIDRVCDFMMTP